MAPRLVPVDYDPFAGPNVTLTPVDYDPFDVAGTAARMRVAGTTPAPDPRDVAAEQRRLDRNAGVSPAPVRTPEDARRLNRIGAGAELPGDREALYVNQQAPDRRRTFESNADSAAPEARDTMAYIGTRLHQLNPQQYPWLFRDGHPLTAQEIGELVMRSTDQIAGMSPQDATNYLFGRPEMRPARAGGSLGQPLPPPRIQDPLLRNQVPGPDGTYQERTGPNDLANSDLAQPPEQQPDTWGERAHKFLSRTGDLFSESFNGLLMREAERQDGPASYTAAGDQAYDAQGNELYHTIQSEGQRLVVESQQALNTPGRRAFEAAQADLNHNAYNFGGPTDSYTTQAAESLVQMLPVIVAGVVTRGRSLEGEVEAAPGTLIGRLAQGFGNEVRENRGSLGTLYEQQAGQQYGQSRAAGRSPEAANVDAMVFGLAEAIPEALPMGSLMRPGGHFLPRLLRTAGFEGASEVITQGVEDAYSAGVIGQDMTWGQAWRNMRDAGIIGGLMGGGMTAVEAPFHRLGETPTPTSPPGVPPGIREAAAATQPDITPEDQASPLPTDLIAEGKKAANDALATTQADQIVGDNIGHQIGDNVAVTIGGQTRTGQIHDAFTEEDPETGTHHGAVIGWHDGTTSRERFSDLHDAGARIQRHAPMPGDIGANTPFSAVRDRIIANEAPAGVGGYNALAYNTAPNRNAAGVTPPRPITQMTIGEVYDFQVGPMRAATRGRRGSGDVGSTGAGAYQFESQTLRQNAEQALGPNWRDQPFSPQNQDRIAENLWNHIRGNPTARANTWAAFGPNGHAGSPGDLSTETADAGPQPDFSWIDRPVDQAGAPTPEVAAPVTAATEGDRGPTIGQVAEDRAFGGNRVFPSAPGINFSQREGGITSEPGFAYRTMSRAEFDDSQEQGAFLPRHATRRRYGGEKQWIDGASLTTFNPGSNVVVRVPLDLVHSDRPVAFSDAEVALHPDRVRADLVGATPTTGDGTRATPIEANAAEIPSAIIGPAPTETTASSEVAAQPATPSPQITVERSNAVIRNASESDVARVNAALPDNVNVIPRSDGALVAPKKYEEAIRTALIGDGTRAAPITATTAEHVARAGENVNTEPTPAQAEAGVYEKGHIQLHGLNITIENPKGSTRRGVDEHGQPWETTLDQAHYGYVKRTEGADGEQADVYIGDHPESQRVFVVDQFDPKTDKFDETKSVLGTNSREEALAIYDHGFSDGSGPERRRGVTEMSVDQFREFLKEPHDSPVAENPPPALAQQAPVGETAPEATGQPATEPVASAASENFDPTPHIEAMRQYVATSTGSLNDTEKMGKALGLTSEQTHRVMGALAARSDSGIRMTKGRPAGTRRILLAAAQMVNGKKRAARYKTVTYRPAVPARFQRTSVRTAPMHFMEWVRAQGGVKSGTHDLRNVGGLANHPGIINNRSGLSLDQLGERMPEAGWSTERPTEAHVLDMLTMGSNAKVYRPEDSHALTAAQNANAEGAKASTDEETLRALNSDFGLDLNDNDIARAAEYMSQGKAPIQALTEAANDAAIDQLETGATETGKDAYLDQPEAIHGGIQQGSEGSGDRGPQKAVGRSEGQPQDAQERADANAESGQTRQAAGERVATDLLGDQINLPSERDAAQKAARKEYPNRVAVQEHFVRGWMAERGDEDAKATLVGSDAERDGAAAAKGVPVQKVEQTDMFGTQPGDERRALEKKAEGRKQSDATQKASGSDGGLFDQRDTTGDLTQPESYPLAPRSEWHGEADYEQRGGRLVQMTPDEYLAQVRPLEIDDISRENIDDLKAHIQSGKTLDPLLIRANGKEDGRHRAQAAKELGIRQVPVIRFDTANPVEQAKAVLQNALDVLNGKTPETPVAEAAPAEISLGPEMRLREGGSTYSGADDLGTAGREAYARAHGDLWLKPLDQLDTLFEQAKLSEAAQLQRAVDLIGFEPSERLSSALNSDHFIFDRVAAMIEKEAEATGKEIPAEADRIINPKWNDAPATSLPMSEDVEALQRAHAAAADSDPHMVASEVGWALRDIDAERIRDVLNGHGDLQAQAAMATVRLGYERLKELGVASDKIPAAIAGAMERNGVNPATADELTRSILDSLRQARVRQLEAPKGVAEPRDQFDIWNYVNQPDSSVRRDSDPLLPRRGGRIRALGIADDLRREGATALVGREIGSAEELAHVAQVYRDPRFETLRVFFMKGGKIVHATGVSSRLPGMTPLVPGKMSQTAPGAFPHWLKETMTSSGATGYYLLHNHPSGDPNPSVQDKRVTQEIARSVGGFLGHVVINSNKFAVIDRQGGSTTIEHDFGEDRLLKASKPHPILNQALTRHDQLAELGKAIQQPGYVTLVGVAGKGEIRIIVDYPESDLKRHPMILAAAARRVMRMSGSQRLFVVGSREAIDTEAVRRGQANGIITDAVTETGEASGRMPGGSGLPFEQTRGQFVAEDRVGFESRPSETLWNDVLNRSRDLTGAAKTIGARDKIATAFDRFRTNFQDRVLPLLRTQTAIEQVIGRELTDEEQPYRQEALYTGRVGDQFEKMTDGIIEPMFEAMQENKVTVDELESYLYARHAPSRNARGMKEGVENSSGMSDIEAAAIMSRIDKAGKTEALQNVAQWFDKLTAFALDTRVAGGLMAPEDAAAWRSQWEHYAPLKGHLEVPEEERPNVGQGFSVKGPESKRAFGRRSQASDIVAHAMVQAQEAVIRAEKNRVATELYNLAKANPDPNFWQVQKVSMKKRLNKETGLVETYPVTNVTAEDMPVTVNVKINGKAQRITFNRQNPAAVRAAEAMKRMNEPENVFQVFQHVNQWLSRVNTMLSPDFIWRNALRDMETATANLSQFDMKGLRRDVISSYPKALAAAERGAFKREGTNEWDQAWRDYSTEGGRISFNQIESVEQLKKDIAKRFSRIQASTLSPKETGLKMWDGLKWTFRKIEQVNQGVENATRLSVYKNLVDRGVSKKQAAFTAKEITVNFNRRGVYGALINSAYLFANASTQGSARMILALKHRRVQKIAGSMVVAGAVVAMMNAAMGGNDDDGVPYYDKIAEWEKANNLIFMIPGSGGRYIKIPMAYGYNIFPDLGRQLVDVFRGHTHAMDAAGNWLGNAANSFNPISGQESLANFLAPTVIDPLVDLYVDNRDFADRPIMPDQPAFGPPVPDSQRFWPNVPPYFRALTDFLNTKTGGDQVQGGWIDVSPETLNYVTQQATGSAGATITRLGSIVGKMVDGDPTTSVELNDIPVLRTMIGAKPSWYDRSAFYERLHSVQNIVAQDREYPRLGDRAGQRGFVAEHRDVLELHAAANQAQHEMQLIRRAKTQAEIAYEAGRITRERLNQIKTAAQAREERLFAAFNRVYLRQVHDPVNPQR